jgi:hypothetical protein
VKLCGMEAAEEGGGFCWFGCADGSSNEHQG